MSDRFKVHILLFTSYFILLPLILKAQNVTFATSVIKVCPESYYKFEKEINAKSTLSTMVDHQSANRFGMGILENSGRIEQLLNERDIFFKITPHSQKNQLTNDVLDSVIYASRGYEFKEIFTYNNSGKWLTRIMQRKRDNGMGGVWENMERRTSTYDGSGNMLTYLYERWDNSARAWINDFRITHTYDGSGNELTYLYESWNDSAGVWVNMIRGTQTCDGSGNQLTGFTERWDNAAGVWINSSRDTYTYDGYGNVSTYLGEDWDEAAGMWVTSDCASLTYDGSGNILTETSEGWYTTEDSPDSTIWLKSRCTYTYDSNENMQTRLQCDWDNVAGVWVNAWLMTLSYDNNGNILEESYSEWDNTVSFWINYFQMEYTYDSNGNVLNSKSFYWDTASESWIPEKRDSYTYDSSGNMLTHYSADWDTEVGAWENGYRMLYSYDASGNLVHFISERFESSLWKPYEDNCVVSDSWFYCSELFAYYSPLAAVDHSEDNKLSSFNLSQNFPNPFNPSTTIPYSVSRSTNIKLAIYNSLGQEICVLVDKEHMPGDYQANFDGSSLSSGIYIYKIMSDQFVETKKMLLMR